MPVTVRLTDDAARDLEMILDYVSRQNAPSRAEHVLNRIEEAFQALSAFPQRGRYPRELLDLGVREYREVFFKPYRILRTQSLTGYSQAGAGVTARRSQEARSDDHG